MPHSDYDLVRPRFSWYPDGRQVVASIARRTGAGEAAPDMADHLQLFDLTGAPTRTLPVAGFVGGTADWSPDRRHVVVYQGVGDHGMPYRVVDTTDGRVVATTGLRFRDLPGPAAWWLDDSHLLLRSPQAGSVVTVCGSTLTGQRTGTWHLSVPPDVGVATLILRR